MKSTIKSLLRNCKPFLVFLINKIVGRHEIHKFIDDSIVINILRYKAGNQLTPFYSLKVFYDLNQILKKNNFRPTCVMEIGTGSSLTTLACFLADGASRAVGVDIQPMDCKSDQFYREASRYIAIASGFGWWRSMVDSTKSPGIHFNSWNSDMFLEYVKKVEYYSPFTVEKLPFPDNSFDFIYSCAVLEHVGEPEEAIIEMRRILNPGAITWHGIDLRDHNSSFSNPLEFLRYSEEEWQEMCVKYGEGKGIERLLDKSWQERVYCNRLRASDWVKLFEKNGFQVIELKPSITVDFDLIQRDCFSKPFCTKSFEDLSMLTIQLTLRLNS